MEKITHEEFTLKLFKSFASIPFVKIEEIKKLQSEKDEWLRWLKKYEIEDLERAFGFWEGKLGSKPFPATYPRRAEFCGWVERYRIPIYKKPEGKREITKKSVEIINDLRKRLGLPLHNEEEYLTSNIKNVE